MYFIDEDDCGLLVLFEEQEVGWHGAQGTVRRAVHHPAVDDERRRTAAIQVIGVLNAHLLQFCLEAPPALPRNFRFRPGRR